MQMDKLINGKDKFGTVSIKFEYGGVMNKMADFIKVNQLMDENLWQSFYIPFEFKQDASDNAWRCEFWGKMMRGAALVYRYAEDEELYLILKESVEKILGFQDEAGRISSYTVETEFNGWDMWGRKYVLLGMLYFYDIAKEDELKKKIINSLKKQLDYIVMHIGKEEGKKPLEKTSNMWGSVNSFSILEPVVWIYKLTDENRYIPQRAARCISDVYRCLVLYST